MKNWQLFRELAARHPQLSKLVIVKVVETLEVHFEVLDPAKTAKIVSRLERKHLIAEKRFARKVSAVRRRLVPTASELHRKLVFPALRDIDHEHLAAILVYGFVFPTSTRTFAKANYLPLRHIRRNVQGKLKGRYRPDAFHAALHAFLAHGVIFEAKKGVPGNQMLLALETSEKASRVTSWGGSVIRAVKQFSREEHRAHS